MKRTILGTAALTSLLALGAVWAGDTDGHDGIAVANAAYEEPTPNLGGKVELRRLAAPAGDEAADVLRRDSELSAGFEVIDRRSTPAGLIKESGFDREKGNSLGAQAVIKNP